MLWWTGTLEVWHSTGLTLSALDRQSCLLGQICIFVLWLPHDSPFSSSLMQHRPSGGIHSNAAGEGGARPQAATHPADTLLFSLATPSSRLPTPPQRLSQRLLQPSVTKVNSPCQHSRACCCYITIIKKLDLELKNKTEWKKGRKTHFHSHEFFFIRT